MSRYIVEFDVCRNDNRHVEAGSSKEAIRQVLTFHRDNPFFYKYATLKNFKVRKER